MTTCYPALRGKFGRTEYFLTTMPVSELVNRVKFPAEMPEWESLSIEDKYQRRLDMGRIRRELAPYFATDDNRFSGSLVMAVINHASMSFERLPKLIDSESLPKMYDSAISDLGFVIMGGAEVLVPLDGQHRAKAFAVAIEGHSDDKSSYTLKPNMDLARDTVAVILVRFNEKNSRYIFNKINRYAKPTAKADKLITDDDDSIAVITRRLIAECVIPTRLVNIASNALAAKAHEFTTLATLYEANRKLVSAMPVPSMGKPEEMDERERSRRQRELEAEWRRLLNGVSPWKRAVADPTEKGDEARISLRRTSVLGRPIGQISLINGYALACKKDRESADKSELVARLNRIDWSMTAPEWKGLLVRANGKIMSGKPASNNAGIVIAHRIGAQLNPQEKHRALLFIHGDEADRQRLPPRVSSVG